MNAKTLATPLTTPARSRLRLSLDRFGLPLVFILLCWAMVKLIYRDIPLEDDDAA